MDQLAEATRERGRVGKKLGAIMLDKGMLTELQLAKVLALQKRHRDNTAKKTKQTPRRKTPRRRIPTPKDWVATEPVDARPRKVPRRQRRTDDVVREHLHKEEEDVTARQNDPRHGERSVPPRPGVVRRVEPRAELHARPDARERDKPAAKPAPPEGYVPRAERPTPPARRSEPAGDSDEPPVSSKPRQGASMPPRDTPRKPDAAARSRKATLPDRPTPLPPESARIALESSPGPASASQSAQPPPTKSPDGAAPDVVLEPYPWAPPTGGERIAFLHEILEHAAEAGASDVHVHAGMVAKMRLVGGLTPITEEPLSADATETLLRSVLTPWQERHLDEAGEIDIAYPLEGVGRFRTNIYRHQRGYNGVFHIIPSSMPSLASLGLPEALAKLTNYTQGLILLTGPGGSGKTSTLAALIDILNTERDDHILTIEDPIEYVHQSKRCVVNQRQVGRHTASFARGLRGALREDPDVICIGELRDLETISLALSAAETGHLVLATLHTGSCIGTVNRVVGAYPPSQQPQVRAMMSESLRAVTSQRLIPTSDGKGTAVALEVLYINKAVGNLIRDNRTFQIRSIMQTGRAHGMQLLDDSIRDLLRAGEIDQETAEAYATDPRSLAL